MEQKSTESIINNEDNTGSIDAVFGVHSASYDLALVDGHPFSVDIPISGHIARWNVQSKQREASFHCHDAMISSIQRSPCNELTATCGYDGMLKIWDRGYHDMLCCAAPSSSGLVSRV